ncbi:hypothetical protein CVT25_013803 [Psilocybe cyanescens]|uniref:Alpha-type protein kinase domain-containing protein n=1 Tax=Psilocybe cyanescens TaxID=93625 RepID=A0A409XUX2_PSICY|nr:hypothetical protein CVT25_013803 [Psilocybe cyanescens]
MSGILFGDSIEDDNAAGAAITTEQESDITELTSSIFARAKVHQSQASKPRLHNSVCTTGSTSNSSSSGSDFKFQNLNKAQKVLADRKKKAEEGKLTEVGIRIAATLWILDNSSSSKKSKTPTMVTPLRVVQVFDPNRETGSVLDKIFGSNEFVLKRLGPTRQLEDRFIEIRFIFTKGERKQRMDDDDKLESRQLQSSGLSLASKRKRPSSRTSTSYESAALSSLAKLKSSTPRREVLKSAFRPPTRPIIPRSNWSRDVEMVICNFTRTSAHYIQEEPNSGQVAMEASKKREVIEVACPSLSEEGGAGFVGKGSTKRGIYARFEGQEYVITVPIDLQMSHSDVQDILEAEYKLLCQCDAFKSTFDAHAGSKGVISIPKFYFNFKGAILGQIIPSPTSGSRPLPYLHFLATPLLPCGPVDAPVKKFTGNGSIGNADDHITRAIHAFAHFSVLYSQENLLFCDLQGKIPS